MNPTLLPSAKLAPQYHLPKTATTAFFPSHLLLGQERAVDAFKLMTKIDTQHLFLGDFPGVDRPLFIKALVNYARMIPYCKLPSPVCLVTNGLLS
uniref:hypothetical protein n=1 Tax=Flavobacterium sp. TaxID=239 RepID=UPI004049233A